MAFVLNSIAVPDSLDPDSDSKTPLNPDSNRIRNVGCKYLSILITLLWL
jgi:hypothetical protein